MQWTPQQDQALRAVVKWATRKGGPQVFRLFGFAGTGKTTLAKEIASRIDGLVQFAAFTGKASLVLRQKGCANASTIHSLIYRPEEDDHGNTQFVLNRESIAAAAALIAIDEVSMVDEPLGQDLLSFERKVLVLGDPFQLPPVNGTGFFTAHEPDVMLTDIRRQALENPIIRMSMDIREGRRLQLGEYGDTNVIRRHQLVQQDVLDADQVLVGLNKTRRGYNARMRELLGFDGSTPLEGDRLVCLRNNREQGLLNGGLWRVKKSELVKGGFVEMSVVSIDDPSIKGPVEVSVPVQFFHGTESTLSRDVRRKHDEFDFGYALTVHKSQGSQWDNVMLFDESASFREHSKRWLYTGVTRAAERGTFII